MTFDLARTLRSGRLAARLATPVALVLLAAPTHAATKLWSPHLPSTAWHDAENWWSEGVPGRGDHVQISVFSPVVLDGITASLGGLWMERSTLHTNGHLLVVAGEGEPTTEVTGTGRLIVQPKADGRPGLLTERLLITGNGALELDHGVVDVVAELSSESLITGHGRIQLGNARSVTNHGTITAHAGELRLRGGPAYRLDAGAQSRLVATDGGILSIEQRLAGPYDAFIDIGPGSLLSMAEPWELGPAGTLELDGGGLIGNRFLSKGHVRVRGTAGDLVFNSEAPGSSFHGTIRVGDGHELSTPGHGILLGATAELRLQAGRFRGRALSQNPGSGPIVIDAPGTSTIAVDERLLLSERVTLGDDLRVEGLVHANPGTRFEGSGALIVAPNGHLEATSRVDFGVSLRNEGVFVPNYSGRATLDLRSFTQAQTGRLELEVAEASHDMLRTADGVTLNGQLVVTVDGDDEPGPGAAFVLIEAAEPIAGHFIATTLPAGFALRYETNRVLLVARVCPGDADGNGLIDVRDLMTVLAAWGPAEENGPGDLNGDGNVDAGDLVLVLQHWGNCPDA